MTKIFKYLPPLNELKGIFEQNPNIIEHYLNSEGFVGDSESILWITDIIKKTKK
jgi:hypothetical protein